jgi:predicted nucleotidyltransferase component of viral defense system
MIPGEEIKEFARDLGVPTSTIERDYAQSWLLEPLSENLEMVFKGGTSIRKLYLGNYRFSDDLDYTLLDDYSRDSIQEKVYDAVQNSKYKSGVPYEDSVKVDEVTNGFRAFIGFRILNLRGYPINIKLDLTSKENEIIKLEPIVLPLINPYSDSLNVRVLSYQLPEILAEKIRSLFQRTRPRDLYDVWRLSKLELDVTKILRDKFEFKGIAFDLRDLDARQGDFVNSWESSLRHQIRDLSDCKFVYGEVIEYLDSFSNLFRY